MMMDITKQTSGKPLGHNVFLTNIIAVRINGYKGKGRPKKTYITEMIEQVGYENYCDVMGSTEKNEKNTLRRQGGVAFRRRKDGNSIGR